VRVSSVCAATLLLLAGSLLAGEGPFELGRRLLEEKRYEEALREALKAVAASPSDPYSRHLEATALYALGRYRASKESFLEALDLSPDPSEIRTSARRNAAMACAEFGRLRQEAGELDEARESLEEAVGIDPDYPLAQLRWGILRIYRSEYRAGEEAMNRVLEARGVTETEKAEAHYWLGKTALDEGRLGEASFHLRKTLESVPGHREARWYLDHVSKSIETVERTLQTETRLVLALAGVLIGYGVLGFVAVRAFRRMVPL